MALITYELDKKMLEYSISQYRVVPEYVKICEAFCVGLATIQTAIDYLSDMIDVDKAEGIWLDYLAWLVGTSRSSYDITQYFCVNAPHLNVEKLFYFEGISTLENGSIEDVTLRKKIKAKVAYNTSKATRNENIRIIEGMVNADKVIIEKAKIFDNFTIVGNPTISSDGVVSDNTTSDYVSIFTPSSYRNKNWHLRGNLNIVLGTNQEILYFVGDNYGKLFYAINWNAIVLRIYDINNSEIFVSIEKINQKFTNGIVQYDIYYDNNIGYWFTLTQGTKIYTSNINSNINQLRGINNNLISTKKCLSVDLKPIKLYTDKNVYTPYTEEPMLLDITLQGEHLIYPSTQSLRNSIESILGNGVGVRNLTIL